MSGPKRGVIPGRPEVEPGTQGFKRDGSPSPLGSGSAQSFTLRRPE